MTDVMTRLLSLKVADVARSDVVSIAAYDAMTSAARTLLEHEISGAPVVDAQGRMVGVLSACDFVRRACACDAPRLVNDGGNALAGGGEDRPLAVEGLPHDLVSRFMSASVQSISAEATLLEAARIMCATHVHRLPVIDERARPSGVVTSLDVVAALVNAVDECEVAANSQRSAVVAPK